MKNLFQFQTNITAGKLLSQDFFKDISEKVFKERFASVGDVIAEVGVNVGTAQTSHSFTSLELPPYPMDLRSPSLIKRGGTKGVSSNKLLVCDARAYRIASIVLMFRTSFWIRNSFREKLEISSTKLKMNLIFQSQVG